MHCIVNGKKKRQLLFANVCILWAPRRSMPSLKQINSWFLFRNSLKRKSFAYVAQPFAVAFSKYISIFSLRISWTFRPFLHLTIIIIVPATKQRQLKKALNLESKASNEKESIHTFRVIHFCFCFRVRCAIVANWENLKFSFNVSPNIIRIKV